MTGAAATTNPDYASSWFDETTTTSTPGASDGALNGTTPVTVVAAPAASTQRVIKEIVVYNRDTASVTFYVKYVSGGTRFLKKVTLAVDEQFTIEANYDSTGAIKTAIASIPVHGHTGSSDGGQLNAGSVFSAGQVPLARGGTNADLSATGGTGQYLKQSSAAANITVGTIADADLPTTLAGKTLTTPTIASFTNATHNHSDAAGGGNLGANAFSSQSANVILAGPTSGGASTPAFRAIVTDDLPLKVTGNPIKNPSFDVWENGVSTVPDAYTLTGAGASVAREGTIIKVGTYSLALTRSGTDCYATQDVYAVQGSTYVRSGVYTFGAWVYATAASRARLRMNDGVTTTNSSYHTGGSTWEWLTVTATVGAAITSLNVGLQVDTGNTTAYIDGLMLMQASTLASGYYPDTRPFNDFPQRETMWHDEATVVAGNAISLSADTNQSFASLPRQSASANADAFTHSCWLRAGTYNFKILGFTGPASPLVDWSLDGVNFTTGQDWYSAGATYNVVKTVGSVVVIGDGYHVLKGTVNGKNASSSSYNLLLTKYWFSPSTD